MDTPPPPMLLQPVEANRIGHLGTGASSVFLHLNLGQFFCPPNAEPSKPSSMETTGVGCSMRMTMAVSSRIWDRDFIAVLSNPMTIRSATAVFLDSCGLWWLVWNLEDPISAGIW